MVRQLVKRGAVIGSAVVFLEAAYAVLRPSPDLAQFDPSGVFGHPSNPSLRIAVLGDSSVTAPGVAGREEIWVSRVCERLAETHHVELRSFAVGGARVVDLVHDQLDEAIAFAPDVFFVSVGANDVIKGVPSRRFAEHLDHLIGELAATGAKVIQSGVGDIGSIPRLYPPLSNIMSRRALTFDRVHWDIAGKHGTSVVDQRGDDRNVWYDDASLWAEDLFHVSAAGHARWASTAWETIEPLLIGRSGSL